MRAHRESGAVKIGDQSLFVRHGKQRRGSIDLRNAFQQWPRKTGSPFHLP